MTVGPEEYAAIRALQRELDASGEWWDDHWFGLCEDALDLVPAALARVRAMIAARR